MLKKSDSMNSIKIAVVIPLYNKGDQAVRAVQSVLLQTYPANEIFVINDGSIDNGPQLVRGLNEPKVQVITQSNMGESAARNHGLRLATSQYIAFLDADDWWEHDHLESIVSLLEVVPEAKLLSTGHKVLRDGKYYSGKSKFPEGWSGVLQSFPREYADNLSLINSTTACVERDALLAVGGFPIGVSKGPDVITWIKLGLQFTSAHVEVATAVYNQDGLNRTDKIQDSEAPGSLLFLSELVKEFPAESSVGQDLRYLFSRIAFYTSGGFALLGNRKGLLSIRRLILDSGDYVTAFKISLLRYSPRFLLNIARKIRNS